jgi:hypothetical protein
LSNTNSLVSDCGCWCTLATAEAVLAWPANIELAAEHDDGEVLLKFIGELKFAHKKAVYLLFLKTNKKLKYNRSK